jgi:hypothetical protein|tara:strand:+ start:237 stop:635 length:399 start_codon:yes stop_codon:yes gene_type:complete
MKTFKAYLTEDVNPGYEGMAGEHNIDDADVKSRLNAILGHTASMEFINPRAAVAQMEAKLSLLGLSHDGNINDIDMSESGEFEITFSRYGDIIGKTVDTPHDEIEEEKINFTMKIRTEKLDTGSFKVYGSLA